MDKVQSSDLCRLELLSIPCFLKYVHAKKKKNTKKKILYIPTWHGTIALIVALHRRDFSLFQRNSDIAISVFELCKEVFDLIIALTRRESPIERPGCSFVHQ